MTVWQDVDEKGAMKDLVAEACDDVSVVSGFGADYAAGGYLIERKRWSEAAERMTESDRHLFYQVNKTIDAAEDLGLEPMLLLEGEIGSVLRRNHVTAEQLCKYLAGLAVLGVTCQPSSGQRCSAQILARLESGNEPDVTRLRGTPDSGVDRGPFLVQGLPNVGEGTADTLLKHFGSPRAVFLASREDLLEVDGIGPATADGIIEALE